MPKSPVIAIACADIHLSHLPPVARAGEPDWYTAMKKPLDQLKELRYKYAVPILCAGDIFHHWKAPPELINFALDYLPKMYAIAGQHDLPNHNHGELKKSAFGTLVKAGKIRMTEVLRDTGFQIDDRGTGVFGFPWEVPVRPYTNTRASECCKIALVHKYLWMDGAGYTGASKDAKISHVKPAWAKGYDTVIIGDNHTSWDCVYGDYDTTFFNCGSLMRRNADQKNHQPRVGLILADGTVSPHYLDTSGESFTASAPVRDEELRVDWAGFVQELSRLRGAALDFGEALRNAMDARSIPPGVREQLERAMDDEPS